MRVARVRAVGEEARGGLERARDNSRNREHENEERWLSALAKPRKKQSRFIVEVLGLSILKCLQRCCKFDWTRVDRDRIQLDLGIRIQIHIGINGPKKKKKEEITVFPKVGGSTIGTLKF